MTLGIVLMLTTSCSESDFFNNYQSAHEGWEQEDLKVFNFDVVDTVNVYQSYINIRTNNSYAFSNLFLIVKMIPPQGNATIDTLQYQMAKPDGSMLGVGFTDVKEHKLVWRIPLKFDVLGTHTVEIEHAMRRANEVQGEAVLKGVTEIGLQIQ